MYSSVAPRVQKTNVVLSQVSNVTVDFGDLDKSGGTMAGRSNDSEDVSWVQTNQLNLNVRSGHYSISSA